VFTASDASNTVSPDMSAEALFERMNDTKRRKYLVADGTQLLGVISISDMMGFLALSMKVGNVSGARGAASLLSGRHQAL
jgi:CBS domain-containing protein